MKKLISFIFTGALLLGIGCKKEGCTDSTALNYDSTAEKDNGSCTYSNTSNSTVTGTSSTTGTTTGATNSIEGVWELYKLEGYNGEGQRSWFEPEVVLSEKIADVCGHIYSFKSSTLSYYEECEAEIVNLPYKIVNQTIETGLDSEPGQIKWHGDTLLIDMINESVWAYFLPYVPPTSTSHLKGDTIILGNGRKETWGRIFVDLAQNFGITGTTLLKISVEHPNGEIVNSYTDFIRGYMSIDGMEYSISNCINKITSLKITSENGSYGGYEGEVDCKVCDTLNNEIRVTAPFSLKP